MTRIQLRCMLRIFLLNEKLVAELRKLVAAFRKKGAEFSDVIKMGRTQLQDAVPMTLGQEFNAFGESLENEITACSVWNTFFTRSTWAVPPSALA